MEKFEPVRLACPYCSVRGNAEGNGGCVTPCGRDDCAAFPAPPRLVIQEMYSGQGAPATTAKVGSSNHRYIENFSNNYPEKLAVLNGEILWLS